VYKWLPIYSFSTSSLAFFHASPEKGDFASLSSTARGLGAFFSGGGASTTFSLATSFSFFLGSFFSFLAGVAFYSTAGDIAIDLSGCGIELPIFSLNDALNQVPLY